MYAAESSIDEALIGAANLLNGMIAAKAELNLAATVGDPALGKVAEAIASLTAARSAMVAAHKQLDESRLRLGIRTTMTPQNKDTDTQFVPNTAAVERVA